MFGAYQAGAWRAIAELAPPDIVVGASVGALNGLPIASGCTPDHLIERWLDPAAGDALKLFPNHGWRNGWFDPAPLRAQAVELWTQYRPRVPFGLVMVQLQGLHARLVRYPDITPDHLQATCSIPLFLPAVRETADLGGSGNGRDADYCDRFAAECRPMVAAPGDQYRARVQAVAALSG
jgi:predicted acylesterase/phospholipase RssA